MDTLAQIRTRLIDRLDTTSTDTFYPETRLNDAINLALTEAADDLSMTVARRRFQTRIADVTAVSGATGTWDSATLTWTLPANFRRPYMIKRESTKILPTDEENFSSVGTDHYPIQGNTLQFTEDTECEDIEVFYIYKPTTPTASGDTPDWIEGYEEYLAVRAAMTLIIKGDTGDASTLEREATRMWSSVMKAALRMPQPSSIVQRRSTYGEDWYG